MALKKLVIPKTFGGCADLLYKLQQERLAKQREVEAIAAQESALKEHVISNMPKSDSGAAGKTHAISIYVSPEPILKDEKKFHSFIVKNNAWELLGKRLMGKAFRERWDAGKTVPGVEKFDAVKISLTKVKK